MNPGWHVANSTESQINTLIALERACGRENKRWVRAGEVKGAHAASVAVLERRGLITRNRDRRVRLTRLGTAVLDGLECP